MSIGLSRFRVATVLGVSTLQLADYEKGRTAIPFALVCELADLMLVNPEALFDGHYDKFNKSAVRIDKSDG